MSTLNVLFIGDIVGSIGRKVITTLLPDLRTEFNIDIVIANGENAAHGKGITLATAQELFSAEIDWLTTGDHCFDQPSNIEACFNSEAILRPANLTEKAPGKGFTVISTPKGDILLLNLIGQAFMNSSYSSPFEKWQEIDELFTDKNFSAIIIDIHAEATSEKIALKHLVEGKASALLGTHTHVQTADSLITAHGTGYITDVGMTGYAEGVIGVEAEPILKTFLTGIKQPKRLPENGQALLNGVYLEIDSDSARCQSITPIQRFITIN